MENHSDYQNLISEIIKKQMDILGPEIALRIAGKIPGLKVGEDGLVKSLSLDPKVTLQKLVEGYISLAGEIVKNILKPVFAKYPTIELNL